MYFMPLFSRLSDVLSELRGFVVSVDDDSYVQPVDVLDGATLGQHVRHATEFYICLLESLNSAQPVVNYEARRRNPHLEQSRKEAISALKQIEVQLLSFREDRHVSLLVEDSNSNEEMLLPSSLYREYAYNIEHSIHHMAMLRMGAKEVCKGLQLSESFGVAKGTIDYRKTAGTT